MRRAIGHFTTVLGYCSRWGSPWVVLVACLLLTWWADPASTLHGFFTTSSTRVWCVGGGMSLLLFLSLWWLDAIRRAALGRAEQAADSLRRSEAEARMLALVADRTSSGVAISDSEGRIEWINEGFSRLTGYSLGEVTGRRAADLLRGPETDLDVLGQLHETVHRGKPATAEIVNYSKSGWKYHSAMEVLPVCNSSGRITNFISIETDISDRVAAEAELRGQEQRYHGLFESAVDGLLVLDPGGTIVEANRAAYRLWGYVPGALSGRAIVSLFHPDHADTVEQLCREAESGDSSRMDATCVAKDGTLLDAQLQATRFRFQDNPHVLVAVQDISLRLETQQRLQDYATGLESANRCLETYSFAAQAAARARGEFVDAMRHELNTQMTTILGFAELLSAGDGLRSDIQPDEGGDAALSDEAADAVLRASRSLRQLVEELFDLAKIEPVQAVVKKTRCNPREITRTACAVAAVWARVKHVAVEVEFPGPIPETIETDPIYLRQILLTLLRLAVHSTPNGTVCLLVRMLPAGQNVRQLELAVSGVLDGFPWEESSQQAEASADISVSRQMARRLGGDLSVETTPGAGATYRLTIDVGSLVDVAMIDADDPGPGDIPPAIAADSGNATPEFPSSDGEADSGSPSSP